MHDADRRVLCVPVLIFYIGTNITVQRLVNVQVPF
jgi:hypothetical protein